MTIYLFYRFFSYKEAKFHYFLIDFCYFLNLSTWMQILVCPNDDYSEECEIWFKSNFVMSICPISFAIIGWNCSLVFHSVDKVTSFMVHVLPGKIKLYTCISTMVVQKICFLALHIAWIWIWMTKRPGIASDDNFSSYMIGRSWCNHFRPFSMDGNGRLH